MKCRPQKSFNDLSKAEQERLSALFKNTLLAELDRQEIEMQKIWLKLCCWLLHDCFDFDEDKLVMFLGNWAKYYRMNRRCKSGEEQANMLNGKMAEIFPKDGYPESYITHLGETK